MNPGLRMYLLHQGEEYDGAESRHEQEARQSQPAQYTRNETPGEGPQDNEMRRRRGKDGRYMADDGGAESRYRGEDGRWKAGRRSAYDGNWPMQGAPVHETRHFPARSEDDDDGEPERKRYGVTAEPESRMQGDYGRENHWQPNQWPYAPGMEGNGDYRQNRQIGFGAARMGYDDGAEEGRQTARVGGTMWMEPEHNELHKLTREMAEKWVNGMRGEDPARPTGGRWSMEELKSAAQKLGVKADGEEFFEFYAMTNAFYADFCEVLKKFGFSGPEHYGLLAKAWMDDRDALPEKTMRYYKYVVDKRSA